MRNNQHGFIKVHFCQANRLTLYKKLISSLDKATMVYVIHLNFTKLFASVSHKLLRYKLRSIEVG